MWERGSIRRDGGGERADDATLGFDIAIKVLFSEADFELIARMAESDGVSVARCVRRMVVQHVQRITTSVRSSDVDRSR